MRAKVVKHLQGAGLVQPEHHATAKDVDAGARRAAAVLCCAIKVASIIEDQAGGGTEPVLAVEGMQYLFIPASARCGSQLEHRAAATHFAAVQITAVKRSAIKVAARVHYQARNGHCPVRRPGEAVEYGQRLCLRRLVRNYPEHKHEHQRGACRSQTHPRNSLLQWVSHR